MNGLRLPDDAIERVARGVAEKQPLWEVARQMGVPWSRLARWIFEDPDRALTYSACLRVCADELAIEALRRGDKAILDADAANMENVPLVGMRGNMRFKGADLNLKVAAAWDKARYGQGAGLAVQAVGNITIIHESQ